ncbi:LysR family transcriptional regulator [Azospirillum brasilense]|uniref:LysR family transcriptional regulator n=1 Tax=Azospirillum brasilense TaxID=192 RepID=UPI000E67CB15|nr:LysR family transcriptional regulator [Azospirillum brasilense]NUB25661.1 LysR family transcriptional regulator [Azospirillum brasilense]NUB33698.1 LysR family transcriptional regulator [Azospirillum brasilense]RIV99629.1 LysR family transcriptional regulator [Azospirillum brasilense]
MFRKFVYLLALAREQHFGRAAEACHVSQPTLSNAIRQLEDELRVPIVERGQKFSGFTPEGLKVLEYARRIVAERDGLYQELTALGQGLSGHLRIGAIPTALPAVPHVLARFAERYPQIRSSVRSLSSRDIQRDLDGFELDAAITYLDNEPLSNVRTVPLFSERYFLLAQRRQVGENTTSIRWADAAKLPLCLLTPDMQNRRIADTAFRMADRTVVPLMETNSIVTIYTIVRSGLAASVVPSQLLTLVALHPDLVALPLTEPDLTYAVGLVYADREPPAPLAKALAAVAAEPGLAERVRALTDEALAPWGLSKGL